MNNTHTARPRRLVPTNPLYARLCSTQALYYLVTALWPLVSIRSFMRVTGPKTDTWLVKTVSMMILAVGLALAYAGRRAMPTPEVPRLAVSSAVGLGAVDIIYVAQGRIAPVYLLDALAEGGLIGLWAGWQKVQSRASDKEKK